MITRSDKDAIGILVLSFVVLVASGGILLVPYLVYVTRVAHRTLSHSDDESPCIIFGKCPSGGQIDADYRSRLDKAGQLLRQNPNRLLIILGGYTGGSETSEARLGWDYLSQNGFSDSNHVLEEESNNTLQNLRNARSLLKDMETTSVILVSNRFHIARCATIARSLGMTFSLCAAEDARRSVVRYFLEAFYIYWFHTGKLWARLTRNQRMLGRIT